MNKKDRPPARRHRSRRENNLVLYLLMVPGLLYLLINNYLPMFGIFIAFKRVDYSVGIFKSQWVGLRNFKFLFATPDAWVIIRNTVVYNIVFLILETVFGIALAIMFADMKNQILARFSQATILLPNLVSMVICSYLVFAFLSQENGILEDLNQSAGTMNRKYGPISSVLYIFGWRSVPRPLFIWLRSSESIKNSMNLQSLTGRPGGRK